MSAVLAPTTLAVPASDRNLWLGIGVSLALHALLLSLHFQFPDASRAFQDKALDIILVNSKSAHKPEQAQALAQTNLDGGGNVDEERRAQTPLPPSTQQKSGTELEQAQKRVQALEAKQQRLLAQAKARQSVVKPQTEAEVQPEQVETPSGRDLASNALAMARLEGEISKNIDEYNKRPRKKNIGTRADEYRFAQYVENWRQKVERVGTLNYPEAAKGKLYGQLVLTLTIKSDGSVDRIEINRSSGHKILDDAARRIVMMAGPYAAFPPEIARDTDILEITRSWRFTSSNELETK
ncbi:MAG: TonB family protein [Propionivibrio sp.]